MDNWKDAKVRYGDFSISMRPFSPSVLHGWFAANRKELKKRKEIFFLSRYMIPVLMVFFFFKFGVEVVVGEAVESAPLM
jgi:hypothetical protein